MKIEIGRAFVERFQSRLFYSDFSIVDHVNSFVTSMYSQCSSMEINGWKGEQYFNLVRFASFDLPLSQINVANVAKNQGFA